MYKDLDCLNIKFFFCKLKESLKMANFGCERTLETYTVVLKVHKFVKKCLFSQESLENLKIIFFAIFILLPFSYILFCNFVYM